VNRIALLTGVLALMAAAGYTGYAWQRYQQAPMPDPAAGGLPGPQDFLERNRNQGNPVNGERRPDFSLPDIEGRMHDISEWDGQVVALNFWATWCRPCLREIPAFVALQQEYAGRGLQFVGIALQEPAELPGFIEEHGINYPILAGEEEVARIARRYGNDIGALPYTVFINRQGHIVHVQYGELPSDLAEHIISVLL